jgi:hypothetical protein
LESIIESSWSLVMQREFNHQDLSSMLFPTLHHLGLRRS